ncbi:hypothetical protein PIB30_071850 [Stylosanthes scabra]|uniref:Uncharacterized protein n=1 Tax=Stylosanthes scabra TaxID=79078 RepID=A0ABU6UR59_9FABA|nr:hypothetical protein [Stylosanthes scabra]
MNHHLHHRATHHPKSPNPYHYKTTEQAFKNHPHRTSPPSSHQHHPSLSTSPPTEPPSTAATITKPTPSRKVSEARSLTFAQLLSFVAATLSRYCGIDVAMSVVYSNWIDDF